MGGRGCRGEWRDHTVTNRWPEPLPTKNAIRKSDDPTGIFVTPIVGTYLEGEEWRGFRWRAANLRLGLKDVDPRFLDDFITAHVDKAYEDLHVQLIAVPSIDLMHVDAAVGAAAHVGGRINPLEVARNPEAYLSDDEFRNAGLEQTYEGQVVSFIVSGCTRGFTHEMVRTRNGASYNQQTFRHTDISNTRFRMPETIVDAGIHGQRSWAFTQMLALANYESMVADDIPFEDARTVMPMGTETWIEVRMPWRTFVDTFAYRACYMFYPEMVAIMHMVYDALIEQDERFAKMLGITCETTHACEYRGAEPTSNGQCPFLWAGRRKWMPQASAERFDMKEDAPVAEWDKAHPEALELIAVGLRARDREGKLLS